MKARRFQVDDRIVYRKTKISVHPGQNARLIAPATNGDGYSYCVDKFWVVASVFADGTLLAKTRRGKLHRLNSNDPNLRHATFLEAFFDRQRFPSRSIAPVVSTS
ncbi:MAG: hypothetical protein ACKV2Q_27285 [Planctomycetaceae bacterium]